MSLPNGNCPTSRSSSTCRGRAAGSVGTSVSVALPALLRSEKLQKRAARVGFDWDDIADVRAKLLEEIAEVDAARTRSEIEDEIGDVLFAAANLARHHKVDPEVALRGANEKFERRFRAMEERAGEKFAGLSLADKEALWQTVKKTER